MPDFDLVIRARRAVTVSGEIQSCAVAVNNGRIAAVESIDTRLSSVSEIQLAQDEVLIPGIVDSHVHVNDPGRAHWEGFASATRAAAAGGITTIADMPLNSIPATTDSRALNHKRDVAGESSWVDVAFWGGAVPDNQHHLRPLHQAGVVGFKCFLIDSGVDEFPALDTRQLEETMVEVASFGGLLIVHAEDALHIADMPQHKVQRKHSGHLKSRPQQAETAAVRTVIDASARTGCRAHIVHVSAGETIPLLDAARRRGVPVSAETCPHYLTFDAAEVPDGATQFKCCPPIRGSVNREMLWEGLRSGVLETVVTDHSPSPPDLKSLETGNFASAWAGISSLQLSLSAVWTQARQRGFTLPEVIRWMSSATAELLSLPQKGAIEAGRDADLAAFAPDQQWTVAAADLHHKHPVTPYDGRRLVGKVRRTWLRGNRINLDDAPSGQLVKRDHHDQ